MDFENDDSANFDFNYNWDEISVGNFRSEYSGQSFFGRRHPEHEKVKQEALTNFHMADEQKSAAPDKNQNDFNSENYQINGDDAENNQNSMNAFQSDLSSDLENLELKNDGRSDESDKPSSNVRPVNSGGAGMKKNKELNVVLNIEIMNLKRKARLEAIERQEREQRKFHSKPAPDFNRIHSAQAKKRAAEPMKVTHPQSPSVLRHHREAQERKQKKKEEIEAARRPKVFTATEAGVLKQKPFVPKIGEKPPVEPAPFNLQSEERLKARHEFDENVRLEAERKQREREEQQRAEDERVRREIRKGTTFKANPNPFSSS